MNRALIFLAFSTVQALAGPWDDFLQARGRATRGEPRWTLCVRPNLVATRDLVKDEAYQRLAVGGGWGLEVLNPAQAQDLKGALGADWALLGPAGDVAGKGRGVPTGERLLAALHARGARARWEEREAFLHEHPGQGDALLEDLALAMNLLRARLAALDAQGRIQVPLWHPVPGPAPADDRIALAGSGADALAGELYREAEDAFRRLTRAPGWHLEASAIVARLGSIQLGQSSGWRDLFAQVAEDLEPRVAADPRNGGLLRLWMTCLEGAGRLPETLSGRFTAPPGSVWPRAEDLTSLLEPFRRRRDFTAVARLLEDLTPAGPPEPLAPKGWEAYCDLRSALLANQAVNSASQGAWDQARAAMDEASAWGGSHAVRTAFLARGHLDTTADPGAWRRLLFARDEVRHRRPPMPEQPPPLRLALLGLPPWLLRWTALREAPELAAWSPSELRWEIPGPRAHAEARARHGWDARPRWALLRGEELLASGDALPAPQALAAELAAHGTPLLERLRRLLSAEPGHEGARRARFRLLLARMPERGLEPELAGDAAEALLELPFGPDAPWKPDPDLWGAAAQAVLPRLEERLRTWPRDAGLWKAWIAWSRFHPGRPSLLALAEDLPHWSPGADWRAALPYPVLRRVAAELRRQGAFPQMRAWFQAAWDRLDQRPARDLRPWERRWILERRAEEDTAVYQPLREALRALGLHAEQVDLERTFAAMMAR